MSLASLPAFHASLPALAVAFSITLVVSLVAAEEVGLRRERLRRAAEG